MTLVYAEAESVVRSALASAFADVRVVTELPANLGDVLPVVEVSRFGGSDDVLSFDNANVDVDVYAASRGAARTLAEQVRAYMRGQLPGQTFAGAFVLSVSTISAPMWTPYDNTALRRFNSSYRIRLHSLQTS